MLLILKMYNLHELDHRLLNSLLFNDNKMLRIIMVLMMVLFNIYVYIFMLLFLSKSIHM